MKIILIIVFQILAFLGGLLAVIIGLNFTLNKCVICKKHLNPFKGRVILKNGDAHYKCAFK